MAGMGFILDFNKKLDEGRRRLSRRSNNQKKSSDEKDVKKVPNHVRRQIHKENKRRDIISAVVTITLIGLIGLVAFLMFFGYV